MSNFLNCQALELAIKLNLVVDASGSQEELSTTAEFDAWHKTYSNRFSKSIAVWNCECPFWDTSFVKVPEGWELVASFSTNLSQEKWNEPILKVIVARKGVWQPLCVETYNNLNKAPKTTLGDIFNL